MLTIRPDQEIGKILKKEGLLKTQRFLENYYLLSNDNVTVLVDALRPRVVGLYSHGKFGTFQQLLYDTSYDETMFTKTWGIYPACEVRCLKEKIRFYPFDQADYFGKKMGMVKPRQVEFREGENRVKIAGLNYLPESEAGQILPGKSMEIQLEGDELIVLVEYPAEPWVTEIHTRWYPLYIVHEEPEQGRSHMNYNYDYHTILGNETILSDPEGRMPRLRLRSKYQRWEIIAERDKERGGAYRLEAICRGKVKMDEVRIKLIPNPVTVVVNPYLNAGREECLTILSQEEPRVKVDKTAEAIKVKPLQKGTYEVKVKLCRGEHFIEAETVSGKSRRRIYAIENLNDAVKKVADTMLTLRWETPELKGFFPHSYYLNPLERRINHWGEEEAVCTSYGMREGWLLSAAFMLVGDSRYAEAALELIEAFVRVSHESDDGGLLFPPDLHIDGSATQFVRNERFAPDATNTVRPVNQFHLIYSCLRAYESFKKLGDEKIARRCIEYGIRFTSPLFKMQAQFPDGRMQWWYLYYNLKPGSENPEKFVPVPIGLEVLKLAEVIEKENMSDVMAPEKLRDFCRQQIEFLDSLPQERFATLSGAEAASNSPEWRRAMARGYIMRAILDPANKEKYLKTAKEAMFLGLLQTHLYLYAPQFYFQSATIGMANYFNDRTDYAKLAGKGSMTDGTGGGMGLLLKEYFGLESGDLVVDYMIASRLSTSLLENGGLCGCEIDVPGYAYKFTHFSTMDTECAWLGILAYYRATGKCDEVG